MKLSAQSYSGSMAADLKILCHKHGLVAQKPLWHCALWMEPAMQWLVASCASRFWMPCRHRKVLFLNLPTLTTHTTSAILVLGRHKHTHPLHTEEGERKRERVFILSHLPLWKIPSWQPRKTNCIILIQSLEAWFSLCAALESANPMLWSQFFPPPHLKEGDWGSLLPYPINLNTGFQLWFHPPWNLYRAEVMGRGS